MYELEEANVPNKADNLLKALDAFRNYLNRNKTAPLGIVATYHNFIRVVRRMVKLKKEIDYVELVNSTSPLVEKHWLLEKIKLL